MRTHFINKLPIDAQTLFLSDPKKFRILYKKQFEQVVKQDVLRLAEISTPVFEEIEQGMGCDRYTEKHYWYSIEPKYQDEAFDIFQIYCGGEICKSYKMFFDNRANELKINKTILDVSDLEFFNLLRMAFYYNNYKNKNKWTMQYIKPRYKDCGNHSHVVIYDFVETLYSNDQKLGFTMREKQSVLNQKITTQCKKIANDQINTRIKSIQDMNRKIIECREFLAKHDKDFVKGY